MRKPNSSSKFMKKSRYQGFVDDGILRDALGIRSGHTYIEISYISEFVDIAYYNYGSCCQVIIQYPLPLCPVSVPPLGLGITDPPSIITE